MKCKTTREHAEELMRWVLANSGAFGDGRQIVFPESYLDEFIEKLHEFEDARQAT